LDLAKEFDWAKVKHHISMNPAFVGVQPCGRDGTVRWSALHQAAFAGSKDAVRFLLDHHAPFDAKSNDGKTPLDVAKNDNVRAILRNFMANVGHTAGLEKAADLRTLPTPFRQRAKAMKATKGRKAGKAMKCKPTRSSKVAKGKRGKVLVYKGRFEKTVGGLTKEQLVKNKAGKVVSKRMQAHGKKSYANIKGWVDAFMKARVELGLVGFVAIKTGSPLYAKTKELYQS